MHQRLLRFLIAGGLAAAAEYCVFLALQMSLSEGWLLANQSFSFAGGFVISFLLNRHWVFRSSGQTAHQLMKYAAVATINLIAGNLIMFLMTGPQGINPLLAKGLVMGMIATWNYVVFSRLVFSKPSHP